MELNKKTVRDVDLSGKRVLMRVDFNVPMDNDQNITDDSRIQAALPTIKHCLDQGASLILMSHLGRPKEGPDPKFSLAPAAKRLGELLGKDVTMAPDCVGPEVEKIAEGLQPGRVVMLENTRFHKEETKNDEEFSKKLAKLGDVYVNDAFGSCHRAHCSTEGVTKFLRPAVAGFLVEKELEYLGKTLMENPKRPLVAILGGAKVSTKIDVIGSLLDKVDVLLIGGGMAYTFIKAKGGSIGKSLLEEDQVEEAGKTMKKAEEKGIKFVLPVDHVTVTEFKEGAEKQVVAQGEIPDDREAVDIGPKTIELFANEVKKANTVFWNGPLGVFEIKDFAVGTFEIAKVLAGSGATIVIGGGDSAAAVKAAGLESNMDHISTGGGASLEFVEGKELPGVAALDDK
jgi:phosphoglycerate kinase